MKKTGLYKKMRMWATLPILFLGVVLTIICFYRFKATIYEEARRSMLNIASAMEYAYALAYDGDYLLTPSNEVYELSKGDTVITNDETIVDHIKDIAGVDCSLIYMDVRMHTTFKEKTGKRLIGTATNEQTADAVLEQGKEAFYKDVPILNEHYLVLYKPLRNSDDSVIGMIEIARNTQSIRKSIWMALLPIMCICVLFIGVMVFFSYRNTREITDVLKKVQVFLNTVSGGNLQAELDSDVVRRKDELGEISKASTAMQRSIRAFVETDPLTQLPNRRFVTSALQKIRDRADETGMPFSVAIADIDFFKKVNDTYGHNAGDEVLKEIARQLKMGVQGLGFAARWGGEEFILVFDKCNKEEAAGHLQRILENIRETVVQTEGYDISVTMTFGVTDGASSAIETLVEAADAKLYYGKQHGRNRVVYEDIEDMEEKTNENA